MLLFQVSFALSMYIGVPLLLIVSGASYLKGKTTHIPNTSSAPKKPFKVNTSIAERYGFNEEQKPQPNPQKNTTENTANPVLASLKKMRRQVHEESNNGKDTPKVPSATLAVTEPIPYAELSQLKFDLERLGASGELKLVVLEKGYGASNRSQNVKLKESSFKISINPESTANTKTSKKKQQPEEMEFLKPDGT